MLAALTFAPSLPLRAEPAPPAAAKIPLESFFAEADMTALQVSPDGHYLAFLTTLGTGKVGIALMDLNTGKTEALVAAKDENIKTYFWKGSEYIVFGGDVGGNESISWRSISLAKRNVVDLAQSLRQEDVSSNPYFGIMVSALRFDPIHILVYGNKEAGGFSVQYWKADVRTGERRAIDSGDNFYDGVSNLVDTQGNLRARSRFEGEKVIYEVRPQITGLFTRVAEFPINGAKWAFLEFAADDETLYLLNMEHSDTGTLQTLNVRTKQLGPPLLNVADGEIGGILMSWDRTKLYGAYYTTDKTRYHFFDPNRARLQMQIDNALPNTSNYVVSSTADEQLLIVDATNDRDPGTYYVLDLKHPRLMAVGRHNHRINSAQMCAMRPIQYTARDGLVLRGYLTRPLGSDGKKVPLIIHPHGGPYGVRDDWGFDPEVQYLANRGYAVLQVNYRGSGGYGTKFMEAGKREWGGKMQDDLTDGVKWAIAQGITDADHVAIYGASYGGYAALAGVTFTPELYKCAINYVGVSDLNRITSWGERYGRGSDLYAKEWIGDDSQYKHDHSPLNSVEKIHVPLLNAYGYNDPRVDMDHWKRLEPQLKKHAVTYEIIIEENEGHGFKNEAARLNFYRHMEAFLAKYFPAN